MTNSLFYQLQLIFKTLFFCRKIYSLTKKKKKQGFLFGNRSTQRKRHYFPCGLITVSHLHKQIAITRVKRDTSVHFE